MLLILTTVLCWMTVAGVRKPALPTKPPSSVIEYEEYKNNDEANCGVPAPQYPIFSQFSSVWRIVGGKEANRHSLPWQVMVSRQNQDSLMFDCGGSIISAEWVITAAHCLEVGPPKYIFAGAHVVDEESAEAYSRQERDVVETFVHPGYRMDYNKDPRNYYKDLNNDIALLRLDRPLQLNEYVKPVCLPKSKAPDQTMCLVSGWGLKDFWLNIYAMRLQQVYVPLMNWKKCFNILGHILNFSNNMICAGVPFEGKDACSGDSGGPLVCQNPKSGQWELHGIVSWGVLCGDQPGAYTDVYKYNFWIHDKIRKNATKPTPSVASPPRPRPRPRAMQSDLKSNSHIVSSLVVEHIVVLVVAIAMSSYELYL